MLIPCFLLVPLFKEILCLLFYALLSVFTSFTTILMGKS